MINESQLTRLMIAADMSSVRGYSPDCRGTDWRFQDKQIALQCYIEPIKTSIVTVWRFINSFPWSYAWTPPPLTKDPLSCTEGGEGWAVAKTVKVVKYWNWLLGFLSSKWAVYCLITGTKPRHSFVDFIVAAWHWDMIVQWMNSLYSDELKQHIGLCHCWPKISNSCITCF